MNTQYLHRFCLLLAFSTFVLVCSGGLVTSHGAGMTVPDWPTSYGYNMFLFPVSRWVGGIFHEHVHRLIASTVGFLTLILFCWLWAREAKKLAIFLGSLSATTGFLYLVLGGTKLVELLAFAFLAVSLLQMLFGWLFSKGLIIAENRNWLKWLGVIAVFSVILQGVLGGLRVTLHKDQLGIFHGCLAQSFLLLCSFIALATSGWWKRADLSRDPARHFAKAALFLTVIIFCQMAIAATMRHAHAGLSIPDFPTAYGQILPPLDAASVAKINADRYAATQPATSAFLIGLQYLHRLVAYFLGLAIPFFTWQTFWAGGILRKLSPVWSALVVVQILLGAWTIWSNKAADIATAHVAVGALMFVLGGLMTILTFRSARDARRNLAGAVANPRILAEAGR